MRGVRRRVRDEGTHGRQVWSWLANTHVRRREKRPRCGISGFSCFGNMMMMRVRHAERAGGGDAGSDRACVCQRGRADRVSGHRALGVCGYNSIAVAASPAECCRNESLGLGRNQQRLLPPTDSLCVFLVSGLIFVPKVRQIKASSILFYSSQYLK